MKSHYSGPHFSARPIPPKTDSDVAVWSVYDNINGCFVGEKFESENDAIEEAVEANTASLNGLAWPLVEKPVAVAHADTQRLIWIASHLKQYVPGAGSAEVKFIDDDGVPVSTRVVIPTDMNWDLSEEKDIVVLRHVIDTLIVRYTKEITS
jgi:hypothetical protein